MNSKTKIVVLRMKELIYTGIFVLLGLILILLLVIMFAPEKKEKTQQAPSEETESEQARYVPGVYSASIMLGGNAIDLEVTVDQTSISSIRLVNLDEAVTTMYPLMEPALENLTSQIYSTQSLDNITYPEENQYTSMIILDAVRTALSKAELN